MSTSYLHDNITASLLQQETDVLAKLAQGQILSRAFWMRERQGRVVLPRGVKSKATPCET